MNLSQVAEARRSIVMYLQVHAIIHSTLTITITLTHVVSYLYHDHDALRQHHFFFG